MSTEHAPENPDLALARSNRDYSTLRLWTVSWEDFHGDSPALNGLNINGFAFRARLSGLGRWTEVVESRRVALRLLGKFEEALVEARFMNVPAVETLIEDEAISFRYSDSQFGFDLTLRGDGSVTLSRGGSSLKTFHEWYVGLLPSVPGLLIKAIAALNDELHRTLRLRDDEASAQGRDQIAERIKLLSASFSFNLLCHSFKETNTGLERKNLDVMRRNVAVKIPGVDGSMRVQEPPFNFADYGRMDYKASLRHPAIPGISQFLVVEAPSNSNWKALFFSLDYVGENYYTDDGVRKALDAELFLSSARAADAYISFFRDIGLRGFLASVTEGYSFETSAASIP